MNSALQKPIQIFKIVFWTYCGRLKYTTVYFFPPLSLFLESLFSQICLPSVEIGQEHKGGYKWAVSCIIGSIHWWSMIFCMQASELAAPAEREDSV